MMSAENTILNSIITGLVSGVLASIIVYIFIFGKKKYDVWFKKNLYRGVDLSGTWHVESKDYDRREITLVIKQQVYEIEAISTHVLKDKNIAINSAEKTRVYWLKGAIKDRFLTIQGMPSDEKTVGAIFFLFEVVGNGQVLKGIGGAYSSSELKIGTREFTATRVK